MRITGGILRGRLVAVPGGVIRPAMDRMRESVFASLGDIRRCSFLDLFSGSGVIALEAASRGADPVEAVEADPLKRKTLLRNVSLAPVRIQCRFQSVERYIQRMKRPFAIIFCDPPFLYQYKWALAEAIAASSLAASGSLLLLHRNREDAPPADLEKTLIQEGRKQYGRSIVEFLRIPGKDNS
ncbi:MAG: RsmD family RNA methyltransferase [Treponema sp.]|nr:RsmD family RNA methyltransferase [Treponema sp.]